MTFGATPDGEHASVLDVAVGHPILHIEQVSSRADGRVVELSDVWVRGDRLRLQAEVHRSHPT